MLYTPSKQSVTCFGCLKPQLYALVNWMVITAIQLKDPPHL